MTAKKLRIKENNSLLILNKPHSPVAYLNDLPEGVRVSESIDTEPGSFDVIHIFVSSKPELDRLIPPAVKVLKKGGLLWVSYPKKSSGISTDITRDNGWNILKTIGWHGVSMVSIDETWTAFRIRPIEESPNRKAGVSEIDMKNRTVTVPDDLKEALQKEGLLDKFEKMSFTHRKEYVLEIVTAKKAETRQRRIEKTISALKQSD